MNLIKQHIEQISQICLEHQVEQLFIFGSIATDKFSDQSDVDILIQFSAQINPLNYFDNYMDFKDSLEILFQRKVDLVEIQTVKNPILKRSIDRNKIIIYGRTDTKMAV